MSFKDYLIEQVGSDVIKKLEKEAENEVSISLNTPIEDENRKDIWYEQRYLVGKFLNDNELFEKQGLKVSPIEVINIYFKVKMLFAVTSENEYRLRIGCISQVEEYDFSIPWSKKKDGLDNILDEYFDKLESYQYERILITELNSYHNGNSEVKSSLEQILEQISSFFSVHENVENNNPNLFLGFKVTGSKMYSILYAQAQLRTFLWMLKVAGFIYPGQREFGREGTNIIAPRGPVFLNVGTRGCHCWHEDTKEPREKIPNGCLWRSFGYYGISKMWINGINTDFFKKYESILEVTKNPRSNDYIQDVSPILDILSSAVQVFDLGAKVLLINCCLEHLFVPKEDNNNNQKKYIVGGINALNSNLLDRFNELYKLRCKYAHEGFIKKDKRSLGIITESFGHIMSLMNAKLMTKKQF